MSSFLRGVGDCGGDGDGVFLVLWQLELMTFQINRQKSENIYVSRS
jgi:hypothetical protein